MDGYGDYVIYADESGDHSMDDVNKVYPAFVLAFCIFSRRTYVAEAVKQIKDFKFDFWGHDMTVLHSSKLRRCLDDFQFLRDPRKRAVFIEGLNIAIENSSFEIVSMAIDKRRLKEICSQSTNPYELSLEYCIQEIYQFLKERNQYHKLTHVIIESRGRKEDRDLEIAFQKIMGTHQILQSTYPIKIIFADKKSNSIGLQIADLVAYPIGRSLTSPEQRNPAFEIVERKLYGYPAYWEKGLKIFSGTELPEKRKTPDFSEV